MQSEENNNLKGLRKDKGLSIESVASTLKLTPDVIRKLEDSQFEELGAFTYVRGYLNNYANLLGVEAQEYIDLIPHSKIEVPLINTSSNNTKSIKLKRHSKNIMNYAIGTFMVVAVCFSGYYLLKNYANPNTDNIEIVKSDDLEIRPESQTSLSNTANTSDENDSAFHYSSLIPTDESSNQKLVENEIALPVFNENLSDEVVIESEKESGSEDLTDQERVMNYNIVIGATETSWVKVEDSDGVKLHNDLLKPGSISISSDKPVHFRIGNEKNVKVTINGESINLSEFSKKDIADFNWPQES
ncbi:MAG: helix-turn-helix domain-containing protein [Marinicellaceae bacterium]